MTIDGSAMRVGFIGLGDQGGPMAVAVAEAGWPLSVWARRPESLQAVARVAHTVCETVKELAERCDVVELCLREDADVDELLFDKGLLAAMKSGSVLVNHGTGSPQQCVTWEHLGSKAGVTVLDAPVSGGRERATTKALTTMIGGDRIAADRCRPVFRSFSGSMFYLGPAGAGQLAKLTNNVLMAANLKNAEDVLVLADGLGFERSAFVELLLASSGASFALDALVHQMPVELAPHYQAIIGKDIQAFAEAARGRGLAPSEIEEVAEQGIAGLWHSVQRLVSESGPNAASP
jgi:3-hydroxyisobutyrate dehydrogenase-like beta-hydroxyacid dehydrogenase